MKYVSLFFVLGFFACTEPYGTLNIEDSDCPPDSLGFKFCYKISFIDFPVPDDQDSLFWFGKTQYPQRKIVEKFMYDRRLVDPKARFDFGLEDVLDTSSLNVPVVYVSSNKAL